MPNFVKIGPEMTEEIGDKGKKCPRLPVSVLSLFSNRIPYNDLKCAFDILQTDVPLSEL